jgi:hypothetical protein
MVAVGVLPDACAAGPSDCRECWVLISWKYCSSSTADSGAVGSFVLTAGGEVNLGELVSSRAAPNVYADMMLGSQGRYPRNIEDSSTFFNCCEVSHEKRRSNHIAYKYAR